MRNLMQRFRDFWWHDTIDEMQRKMLRSIPSARTLKARKLWMRYLMQFNAGHRAFLDRTLV